MREWTIVYYSGCIVPFIYKDIDERALWQSDKSVVEIQTKCRYVELPFPHYVKVGNGMHKYIESYESSLEA